MNLLPLVRREMSVAARRSATHWVRLLAAGSAILFVGFLLLTVEAGQLLAGGQGRFIFDCLVTAAFLFCLLEGARVTADCLSEEKREGTLGLLFLTDLRGHDILLGKLISASTGSIYSLLSLVPILALAMLLGGISGVDVGLNALALLNTLLFSLSAGLFVSTFSCDSRAALFWSVLLILTLAVGPLLPVAFTEGGSSNDNEMVSSLPLLLISPVMGNLMTGIWQFPDQGIEWYVVSQISVFSISLFLLLVASWALPYVHQDSRQGTRWEWFRTLQRNWTYGKIAQRNQSRKRMLDRNPCYWLSARERTQKWYLAFLLVFLLVLEVVVVVADIFEVLAPVILLTAGILIKGWLLMETLNRFFADRKSGLVETVSGSPLGIRGMLKGHAWAMARIFLTAALGVGVGMLLLMKCYVLFIGRSVDKEMVLLIHWFLILLPLDLVTLWLLAVWKSWVCRSTTRAFIASLALMIGLPIVVAVCFFGVISVGFVLGIFQPYLEAVDMIKLWAGCRIVADCLLLAWAAFNLRRFAARLVAYQFDYRTMRREWLSRAKIRREKRSRSYPVLLRWLMRRWPIQRRWRLAWSVVSLLGMVVVAAQSHRLYYQRLVNQKLKSLEASGIPVTREQFLKKYSDPTGDSQLMETLRQFDAYYQDEKLLSTNLEDVLPRIGIKSNMPAPSLPLPDDMVAAMGNMLDLNERALKRVYEYGFHGSFYVEYESFDHFPWQLSLFNCHELPRLLFCNFLLEIGHADSEAALISGLRMLEFGRTMATLPLWIQCYYASRTLDFFRQGLERAFSASLFDGKQLVRLEAEIKMLGREVSVSDLSTAMIMESITGFEMEWGEYLELTSQFGLPTAAPLGRLSRISGFHEREYFEFLNHIEETKRILRLPAHRAIEELESLKIGFNSIQGRASLMSPLRYLFGHYTVRILQPVVRVTIFKRLLSIAIAIERYRIRYNSLPPDLELLVPDFLEAVLMDPPVNRPFRYELLEPGYRITSVGFDQQLGKVSSDRDREGRSDDITFTVIR